MLESAIQQKNSKGLIKAVVAVPQDEGWVLLFTEEFGEQGRVITHRLAAQRGHERVFKSLNAAASTLRKLGFSEFLVKY